MEKDNRIIGGRWKRGSLKRNRDFHVSLQKLRCYENEIWSALLLENKDT